MKLIAISAAVVVLALSSVGVASAGPASGTTELLGVAHANKPVEVLVTIFSEGPVVAYEYSIVNRCQFPPGLSGKKESYERFDLAGPWFATGPGLAPQTTVTINLQPVPAGSICKVSIVRNNTTVKGSTTQYTVVV